MSPEDRLLRRFPGAGWGYGVDGRVWCGVPVPDAPWWNVYGLFVLLEGRLTLCELRVIPAVDPMERVTESMKRKLREHIDQATEAATAAASPGPGWRWENPIHEYRLEAGEWPRTPEDLTPSHVSGITSSLLRRIPLAEITNSLQAEMVFLDGRYPEHYSRAPQPGLRRTWNAAVRKAPGRPGRAGRDDYYYAVWAHRYVTALDSGKPNEAVAKKYGIEPTQVRDLIYAARHRGLLTPGQRGRAGGTLTDKAKKVLERERKVDGVD